MDSSFWIVMVNLVIWTGLFVFLLRVSKKVQELEKKR